MTQYTWMWMSVGSTGLTFFLMLISGRNPNGLWGGIFISNVLCLCILKIVKKGFLK
jgi:hypothetical protein